MECRSIGEREYFFYSSSIPTFHDSNIPGGFLIWMAAKKIFFQRVVKIPKHLISFHETKN